MKQLTGLIVLILFSTSLKAQEFKVGMNFHSAVPQAEFRESINRIGLGGNLNGYYRFTNVPFGVGLDLNFVNFGKDSREEPLSSNIPDLRVRVENEYNMGQFLFLTKVQTPEGIFRPYLEGLVGFNYLFTVTKLTERQNSSSEPIASDTNFEDFAFAWGGGGGLMIRLFRQVNRIPNDNEESVYSIGAGYLNLGIRYLNGNEAEYLQEGSIIRENGNVTYETSRSRTDLLMLQLGFVFQFFSHNK